MKKHMLLPFFFFLPLSIFGAIQFDTMMSLQEKDQTGISSLTPSQKAALELWVNTHCGSSTPLPAESSKTIHLTENLNNGAQIQLSDGSIYEIDPQSRSLTSLWLTPVPIEVGASNNPDYPSTLTNTLSKTVVNAKKVSP